MLKSRLIPCLDVKDGRVVKGVQFVDLRDAAGRKWKHCTLTGFPRKRLLAWDLLFRALRTLVGRRNFPEIHSNSAPRP